MPHLLSSVKRLNVSGHPLQTPPVVISPDATITFTRVAPTRAAASRFNIGVTFTQDTMPSGADATAVSAFKSLMAACDFDYVNMHSHQFGADGPLTNTDKANGKTYATRSSWSGWTAWDARLQLCRDCSGVDTKLIVSLLPPGWCQMDGGSKTSGPSDPLGLGRSWDSVDDPSNRHTDAHRADMVDIAKAISLRHADVSYFSCWNEQKGNFTPHSWPTESSNDSLNNINDYQEQKRYQEALYTGLTGVSSTAEIMGPYHVLEASGLDTLAATYASLGFPQPHAGAADASHYRQYYATGPGILTRNVTYLEWFQANVSSASRFNFLALDWKTLGGDNDTGNWEVLYPWRWYMFEAMRVQLQKIKLLVGVTGATKIVGMESYPRKVADDLHVPTDAEQGALLGEQLRIELLEGVHSHLRWAPERGASKANRLNLATSTMNVGGGAALPGYTAYKAFCDNFRGVDCYDTVSSDGQMVTAVANATKTLLINHTPNVHLISINGAAPVTLAAHEVKVVTA